EEFLDSDRVLPRLLESVGAVRPPHRRRLHEIDDRELASALGAESVRRRPSAYRSSFPLVELEVTWPDGSSAAVMAKELTAEALGQKKPAFVRDASREPEAYRLLEPEGLGTPRFYGVRDGLLLVERVPGIELYQIGDLGVWEQAVRWAATLHERFRGRELGPPLLGYDAGLFRLWAERARQIAGVDLVGYDQAVQRLEKLPQTLVHGELYASNVLVAGGRVAAVDWETAGRGPGILDLAALVTGWSDPDSRRLVA